MSITKSVSLLAKAVMSPSVPAGTMAALATTVPVRLLSVDTGFCGFWSFGHTSRIAQRIAQGRVRHRREIQRVGLRSDARGYARARQHRKVARYHGRQVRRTQASGLIRVARVGDPAWRQRIEGQRGARRRREVAVDVEDHVGRVGDVNADRAVGRRPARWRRWP